MNRFLQRSISKPYIDKRQNKENIEKSVINLNDNENIKGVIVIITMHFSVADLEAWNFSLQYFSLFAIVSVKAHIFAGLAANFFSAIVRCLVGKPILPKFIFLGLLLPFCIGPSTSK